MGNSNSIAFVPAKEVQNPPRDFFVSYWQRVYVVERELRRQQLIVDAKRHWLLPSANATLMGFAYLFGRTAPLPSLVHRVPVVTFAVIVAMWWSVWISGLPLEWARERKQVLTLRQRAQDLNHKFCDFYREQVAQVPTSDVHRQSIGFDYNKFVTDNSRHVYELQALQSRDELCTSTRLQNIYAREFQPDLVHLEPHYNDNIW